MADKERRAITWTPGMAALVGGVIGGLITGVFALGVAFVQADAEEDQSVAEFIRVQRESAYSDVYANVIAMRVPWQDAALTVTNEGEYTEGQLDRIVMRFDDALYQLQQSTALLQMVGSAKASRVAEDLLSEAQELAGVVVTGREAQDDGFTSEELELFEANFGDARRRIMELARELTEVARDDFDTPD